MGAFGAGRRTARRPRGPPRGGRRRPAAVGAPLRARAAQPDVERRVRRLGAPWVPARASVAGTPGGSGWIPAPVEGAPGPPAFLLEDEFFRRDACAFSTSRQTCHG